MSDELTPCPTCGALPQPEAPAARVPMSDTQRYDALLTRAPEAPLFSEFGNLPDGYDLDGGEGAPGRELLRSVLLTWARLWQRFNPAVAAAIFPVSQAMIEEVAPTVDDYFASCNEITALDMGDLVQMLASPRVCTVADMAAMTNASEAVITNAVAEHINLSLGDLSGVSPTIWCERGV